MPSDTDKVDAVPVSTFVWEVVAKVGSIDADGFTVGEASYVFPNNFLVAEARPAVLSALLEELISSSALGCNKERLAGNRVVVSDLSTGLHRINPGAGSYKRIS